MTLHLPSTLVVGGSSNVDKMSYTHPTLTPSVSMSSMRQREELIKNPFLDFRSNRLRPFNFQAKIFKFKYLGFCSFDWKIEDSSENLEIERRHGEKPILSVSTLEILVSLQLPLGLISGPGPQRNFRNMGFHFFTQISHFLSNPDRGDILVD